MSEKITFRKLVETLSERTGHHRTFSDSFVRELVSIIEAGLEEQGDVSIAGFGKFELRWMDERKGIHPRTGEEITIPGQSKVVFKPYKALREKVNAPFANLEPRILTDPGTESFHRQQLAESGSADDEDEPIRETDPPESTSTDDPFPFYVELDENEAGDEEDELIVERPSPLEAALEAEETSPSIPAGNVEDLARDVQTNGNRRWGWIAAVALVLLLSLMITRLVLQETAQPDETPMATTGENELPAPVEQVDPEPPPGIAEEDPPPDMESDLAWTDLTVPGGASLWSLAESHLGDPYLWPWIYQANQDRITNPDRIAAGMTLTLPVLPSDRDLNRSERREVAEGYLMLYRQIHDRQSDNAHHFLWAAGSFAPELLEEEADRLDPDDLRFALNR